MPRVDQYGKEEDGDDDVSSASSSSDAGGERGSAGRRGEGEKVLKPYRDEDDEDEEEDGDNGDATEHTKQKHSYPPTMERALKREEEEEDKELLDEEERVGLMQRDRDEVSRPPLQQIFKAIEAQSFTISRRFHPRLGVVKRTRAHCCRADLGDAW